MYNAYGYRLDKCQEPNNDDLAVPRAVTGGGPLCNLSS
ncbi:hypothetical protein FHS38_002316 [Streptomyces netropsis]|uniref:Uncharacterized protein n=1 Tax=Streptomyces netropsis TaxID=55404 RepID=A0A7W7L9Y3_STRNE|nr:hypothetical protein [Streptomyces netropsis]